MRKAGAVITRDNHGVIELLLLFRAKQQDWGLPKGHIEAGETAEQAMVREIKEETGLDVAVRSTLPPLEYVTPRGHQIIVFMFRADVISDAPFRTEFVGDILEWIPLAEITSRLTIPNLRAYINAVFFDHD